MKEINVSKILQRIKLDLFYDKNSGKLFRKNGKKNGLEAGTDHSKGYRMIGIDKKRYFVHRIIWLIENGYFPSNQIDHINGVKSDNRIENLRDVSNRKNHQNKLVHKNGKLYGCTYVKSNKKWNSVMRVDGKSVYLGSYDTAVEAHERYKQYERDNNL